MELSLTLIIVIITCVVSIGGFNNQKIIDDLIFYPPAVTQRNQWYRFFSCGLIHADVAHLAFNMISLYLFGAYVEKEFISDHATLTVVFGDKGKLLYLIMYVMALFVCLLPTFAKHRADYYYRSLGASGAVSAVVFAGLLLEPRNRVGFFFIPPIIPGYVFGPLYLIVSTVLEKKSADNINHSAHIWGAIFGMLFVIVMAILLKSDYHPLEEFVRKVKFDLNM